MTKKTIVSGKEIGKIIGASLIGMAIITWFNYNADLYVFRFSAESVVTNISARLPDIVSANALENPDLPENKDLFRRLFEGIRLSGRIETINILDPDCNLIRSNTTTENNLAIPSGCRPSTISEIQSGRPISDWLTGKETAIHIIGTGPLLITHAPIIIPPSNDISGILEIYFSGSDINLMWARLRLIKMAFAGAVILLVIVSFYFIFKKRSAEIAKELEEYAKIFREAPMGIYTINKYGVIDSFNPKMVDLSGAKSASQVVGLNVFKMPSYKEVGLDLYFKEGLSGKSFNIETPYISYTGRKKSHRHYLGSPIMSDSGAVERLLLMVEDITIRKELGLKLAEEKTRLMASIDSLLLGFMILDSDNKIKIINPAFRNISKITETPSFEEVNKYWTPDINLKEEIAKSIQSKEVAEFPKIKHAGRYFRITIAPVVPRINEASVAGKAMGSVVIIEDITEDELLEESKKDFVAIASHEMRTPLSIIRGAAERLLKACSKIDAPEEARRMVSYINESSVRLLDMVNKLLDVAALEGESVQFLKDIFNVNEAVKEVMDELKLSVEKKGLYMEFTASEKLLEVIADRDKTREIIGNVIANGIQYTEKGGIKISAEKFNNFVKISFSDTGIGIHPEMKDLIFRKFRSVHGHFMRSKEYGSGMGLYIARTMAENMGGKLFLEKSLPGEGSVFILLLPASAK